jgi:hypothetical protein
MPSAPDTTIEFKRGANAITVNTPQFGYRTEVHMALRITERLGHGLRRIWDQGADYDVRFFMPNFVLEEDQQEDLQGFFSDAARGRGVDCQLRVPQGIFPFGPDLGDYRRFQVRLVTIEPRGAGRHPWLHFHSDLSFVLIKAPSYSLPSIVTQGGRLRIGSVSGFRFPPEFYGAETRYASDTAVTHGGGAHTLDRTATADHWECGVNIVANKGLTAHLIDHLVGTVRGAAFEMATSRNSYLAGRDHEDSGKLLGAGIYDVRLTHNVLSVTHRRFDEWAMDMRVQMERHHGVSSSSISTSSFSHSSDSSSSELSSSASSVSDSKSAQSCSSASGSSRSSSSASMDPHGVSSGSSSSGSSISVSSSSNSSISHSESSKCSSSQSSSSRMVV